MHHVLDTKGAPEHAFLRCAHRRNQTTLLKHCASGLTVRLVNASNEMSANGFRILVDRCINRCRVLVGGS